MIEITFKVAPLNVRDCRCRGDLAVLNLPLFSRMVRDISRPNLRHHIRHGSCFDIEWILFLKVTIWQDSNTFKQQGQSVAAFFLFRQIKAEYSRCGYLVPDPLSVQGDDDHGRVGEEALAVERQVFPLPRHVKHVPTSQINSQICKHGVLLPVLICIFM